MNVIVTAGPTREFLDPVRFLSNPSTGRMGFAIARAAAVRGHTVTLVSGPVSLATPRGVRRVDVVSARDMLAAVVKSAEGSVASGVDVLVISAAAIADWRPAKCAARKMKKSSMDGVLRLVRNPDVLRTLAARRRRDKTWRNVRLVGFAAETGAFQSEAVRKCREKCLEMIVANDVTEKGAGFAVSTNKVSFVFPDGTMEPLPLMGKDAVARRIIVRCEKVKER